MNNRFKFRVWDKINNSFFINEETKDVYFDIWQWTDKMSTCLKYPIEDCIFQQYTGLNDKNNNLIFEGDIVSFSYKASEHDIEEEIGKVFFSEGIFYFGKSLFASNDSNFITESIEVIGNIFNPPCNFDANNECLICDDIIDNCQFKNK